MDHLSAEQRSLNMSKIRNRNTKPEIAVRKILTSLGLRYRLYVNTLPGKPDIVIPGRKTAVFINGCFWHQHENCRRKSMPKTNAEYWKPKLANNVAKQKEEIKKIKKLGYRPLIIWECQIENEEKLTKRIERMLV